MKLYASAASSFARKVRVLLTEKNVKHDVEILNLWEPNDLHTINPIGKVPALRLDDGEVLIGSSLIAEYIDTTYPGPRFIPADAWLRVKRCEALTDGTMDAVGASLYEMRFHDEATRSQAWLDRQRGKVDGGFAALEKMLGNRAWCVGNAISLADIAIACHVTFIRLRAPRFFSQDRYPGLFKLSQSVEQRESMKMTAPAPA